MGVPPCEAAQPDKPQSPEELIALSCQELLTDPFQAFADASKAYYGLEHSPISDPAIAYQAGTVALQAARQAGLEQKIINRWESLAVQHLPASAYHEVPVTVTLRAMGGLIREVPPTD